MRWRFVSYHLSPSNRQPPFFITRAGNSQCHHRPRSVASGDGDPAGTRTPYLQIRNLSLYPDELRDHADPLMTDFAGDGQMRGRLAPAASADRRHEGNGRRGGTQPIGPPPRRRRRHAVRVSSAFLTHSRDGHRFATACCHQSGFARQPADGADHHHQERHAGSCRLSSGLLCRTHRVARLACAASRPISACLRVMPQA